MNQSRRYRVSGTIDQGDVFAFETNHIETAKEKQKWMAATWRDIKLVALTTTQSRQN